jgi:hypothetical protein
MHRITSQLICFDFAVDSVIRCYTMHYVSSESDDMSDVGLATEESPGSVQISVRIPKRVDDQLREIAAERLGAKGDVVKEALAEFLRNRGLMDETKN